MEAIRTGVIATLVALLAIGLSCTRKDPRKVPKPRILMVSPSTGDFKGGDRVAILTRGFPDNFLFHHPEVTIGGKPAPIDRIVNPAELYVIAPPGPPGVVDVEVRSTDARGKARCKGCYEYGFDPAAGCEFFLRPDRGWAGMYVQLLGHSFGNIPGEVRFGGTPALVAYWSNSAIICVAPPPVGPGTVDIWVSPAGGDPCELPDGFVYLHCTLHQVVPPSGGTNGGDTVYVLGEDLEPDSRVWFGSISADPRTTSVDPAGTMVTCVSPPSIWDGAVDVSVGTSWRDVRCSLPDGYTYHAPGQSACAITRVSPHRGPVGGGTSVWIEGSGFDPGTGVLIGYDPAEVTYVSPQGDVLTCISPPYSGPMVSPPIHLDVSVCPETSDPCTLESAFSIEQASCPGSCAITSISPNEGQPGDVIRIRGQGFCFANPEVSFGMNGLTGDLYWIDEFEMQVVVPAGESGTVPVVYGDGSGCFAASCVGDCGQCDPGLCFTYR